MRYSETRLASIVVACAVAVLAAAGSTARAADRYKVDATHSSVVFRIKHMGVSYCYGRFNRLAGTFSLDEADPGASAIDVTVEADSVDTANEQRDAHLKNADFFDVQKFPAIRFRSTKVGRNGTGKYLVDGELTLHGATRPVRVEIEPTGMGKGMFGEVRSGLETVFTIKRTDYGMDKMVGPVGDDVRLMVSLEGIRE